MIRLITLLVAAVAIVPAAVAAGPPPRITVPADMTVEAQNNAGATVTYTVTAVERPQERPIPVSCDSPSGSIFPFGTTVVTCTATDGQQTATESFRITVVDRTPPALTLPANKFLRTTRKTGVPVTFTPTAMDVVDGVVVVTCTPPSGTTFPIGETVVACSATDRRGNAAAGSFTISVSLVRITRRTALFSPAAGATVTGPPLLAWQRVARARFYNVQVYRNGRKILSRWPARPRLGLRSSWRHEGRTFRLRPGVYTWFVWPAYGSMTAPRYGRLIGKSSFRVV